MNRRDFVNSLAATAVANKMRYCALAEQGRTADLEIDATKAAPLRL